MNVPPEPGPPVPSYAGLATRTLAFAVDALVINLVAWLVGAIVALGLSLLTVPDGVRTIIAAVAAGVALLWTAAYFVFFWSGNGQTPGNRLLGITVREARSGEPLRVRRAALRMLALPLSALPLCAGFLTILVDGRRRALHDRIARTVVVYVPARAPAPPRRTPVVAHETHAKV
ncbi:RDD family protein [Solirubrobacter phytolaccae]|uniref:RDD family protein n=1 Tax=Solirubrobacter phytolaccae TaxID=1404360 RepID=A0A9X3S7S4_9ACTN|nr:RDD family protein [Solirubrobacter phytolaccae]MDA0181369.1 RDD family protein [Solirubrobacter phytolaccae]